MKKKFISTLMVLTMAVGLVVPAVASEVEEVRIASPDKETLIADFVHSINSGDWNSWVEFFTPSVQAYYADFVNDRNNLNNNVGILNVNSTEIISIEKIDNCYAPRFYELSEFMESENNYEVYLVGIDLQVNEASEYFYNGVNYKLVILVNNNGEWEIGGQSGAPIEVMLESKSDTVQEAIDAYTTRVFDSEVVPYGIGYGLLTRGKVPTTIKVKYGSTVYSVPFYDFIKNATMNEIGNMGYDPNAIQAQAMAVKMTGWWCQVAQYRDSVGADLQYGDVAYVPNTTVNSSVNSACDTVSAYMMVSSSATGGKLFIGSYFAGVSNDNGKGSGQLRQNGANYLATNSAYRYNWQQILHYYYDNSSYNNPNVGVVQILKYDPWSSPAVPVNEN